MQEIVVIIAITITMIIIILLGIIVEITKFMIDFNLLFHNQWLINGNKFIWWNLIEFWIIYISIWKPCVYVIFNNLEKY